MKREVEGRLLRILANIGILALMILALSFLNINIPSILTVIPLEGFTVITALTLMITVILFFIALRIILDLIRLVDIASNTLLKHIPGFNPDKSPSIIRALKEVFIVFLLAIAISITTPLVSSIPGVGGWLSIAMTITAFVFSLILLYDAGKTIPSESEEFPKSLSEILGPTFLDFFSFRWYYYDDKSRTLTPWPDGYESFTIPAGSKVAFGVYVCNKDPQNRIITLDEYTHMWMYYSGSGGELKKSEFYIVSVDSDGKVYSYDPNNPIVISYDKLAFLVFAASDPKGTKGNNVPGSEGIGYTNLLIHGKVGDLLFSQNIPFVGITFTKGS